MEAFVNKWHLVLLGMHIVCGHLSIAVYEKLLWQLLRISESTKTINICRSLGSLYPIIWCPSQYLDYSRMEKSEWNLFCSTRILFDTRTNQDIRENLCWYFFSVWINMFFSYDTTITKIGYLKQVISLIYRLRRYCIITLEVGYFLQTRVEANYSKSSMNVRYNTLGKAIIQKWW